MTDGSKSCAEMDHRRQALVRFDNPLAGMHSLSAFANSPSEQNGPTSLCRVDWL